MKKSIQQLAADSSLNRIITWGKIITITGGTQVLVQFLSLASGIYIIRFLPTQEYALYTLANTVLGTMLILADGGISAGILSEGGKVWEERKKLGVVLNTGLNLRKQFAVASSMIAIPILLYLLHHHKASWLMALSITIAIIPAFMANLSGTMLEVAPRLHQDIIPLQKNQILTNFIKLSLLLLSTFLFPYAYLTILISGIPQVFYNYKIKFISRRYVDWHQQPSHIVRKNVLSFVKRIMPVSIYYSLSGQITIWLISIFGSTNNIAQIGALGRLSMTLSVFSVLFSTLIVPRFARLSNDRSLLFSRYLQILTLCIVLTVSIVGIVWLFPSQILWILGEKYISLKDEVFLSVLGSCLALTAGASISLSSSRGWIIHPIFPIMTAITSIVTGISIFNVNSIKGILHLNIFVAVAEIIMHVVYTFIKMNNLTISKSTTEVAY